MTRVKICGITNEDDARAAIECGADALGFIRVPGGPRFVPNTAFVELGYARRLFVSTVVVVRNAKDAGDLHADYVQFYEEDATGPCGPAPEIVLPPAFVGRYIRAFRIRDEHSLRDLESYPYKDCLAAVLLDAFHEEKLGGSGATFNWDLAVEAKRIAGKPIILAGGLNPDNVGEAIARVRPFAVDVSSGVEAEPGRKDHDKLRAFFQAVREANRSLEG